LLTGCCASLKDDWLTIHNSKSKMSEEDKENKDKDKLVGNDRLVIVVEGKRKSDNDEKNNSKRIRTDKHDIIGNGPRVVMANPALVPTVAEVHAIVAANAVGVLPVAFQNLTAAVAALNGQVAALAGLPAQVAALAGQVAALAGLPAQVAALAGLPAQVALNTAALDALIDGVALANNRGCSGLDHPLCPRVLPAANGPIPAQFPPTLRHFNGLTAPHVNVLLNYWQLGLGQGPAIRKRRLGTFLGIPAQYL
jgi:hypothetical protein